MLEVSSKEACVLQKEHPLLQPVTSGGLGSTLYELLLLTCSWVSLLTYIYQQVWELISSRNSSILSPFGFLDLFLTVLHRGLQVCATSATHWLFNLCCSSLWKEQNFMSVDAPLVLMHFLPGLVASTWRDKGSTPVIFYKIHCILWVKNCRSATDLPPSCCLCCCYGMNVPMPPSLFFLSERKSLVLSKLCWQHKLW